MISQQNLYTEAEIYLKILNEKPDPPVDVLRLSNNIKPFCFPTILQQDYPQFKRELQKSTKPLEILKKYKISFDFCEENIQEIIYFISIILMIIH